jgi:hypothetical protein
MRDATGTLVVGATVTVLVVDVDDDDVVVVLPTTDVVERGRWAL